MSFFPPQGGGTGTVAVITSTNGTVDVSDPAGPSVDLSVTNPGTRVTASIDQASLVFSGLTGNTAGGYEIHGQVNLSGLDVDLLLRVNSIVAGYSNGVIFYNAAGVTRSIDGNLGGGANATGVAFTRGGPAGRNMSNFIITVLPTAGGNVKLVCNAEACASATGVIQCVYRADTLFQPGAEITSLTITTASGADRVLAGSYGVIRPLGFTA